jgi:hypothetical protein
VVLIYEIKKEKERSEACAVEWRKTETVKVKSAQRIKMNHTEWMREMHLQHCNSTCTRFEATEEGRKMKKASENEIMIGDSK